MKDFSEITRLDLSTPGYPNGKPKNATSETSKDGTVINDIYLNDQYQFFAKCVAESGITPNGSFDNGNSIYQLFTAVQKALLGDSGWLNSGIVTGSGVTLTTFEYRKTNGFVYLDGQVACANFLSAGSTILTMPSGFLPHSTQILHVEYSVNTGVWEDRVGYIQQTNGVVYISEDIAAGKGLKFNFRYRV